MRQALAILLAAAGVHAAAASEPAWTGPAPDPCRVTVQHRVGDLELHRVRSGVQASGGAEAWALETGSIDGTLVLRTVPWSGARNPSDVPPLRVEVPRDCSVTVEGGAGRVELHGRHDAPVEVETVTGDIVLWAQRRANLQVELLTSGEMGVDYSIDIEYLRHQEPDKRGRVVLGNGEVQVHLASKRGVVRVLDRERAASH